MDKQKILIVLASLAVVLAGASLVVSLTDRPIRTEAPIAAVTPSSPNSYDANVPQECLDRGITNQDDCLAATAGGPTPAATLQPKAREFIMNGLEFSYLNGWHVYSRTDYEATGRKNAAINVYLNPEPIRTAYPVGGPPTTAKIYMQLLDEGEAYMAAYEQGDWKEYKSNSITVNGQPAYQLLLTAPDDEDMIHAARYQEVLFVGGWKIIRLYDDPADANEPAWTLLKATLKISRQ